MSLDPGPRRISKFIEGVQASYMGPSADPKWTLTAFTQRSGWTIEEVAGGYGMLKWEGYIDLSGYMGLDDQFVIQPEVVQCQYGHQFQCFVINMATGFPMFSNNTKFIHPPRIIFQKAITVDPIDDIPFGSSVGYEPLAGYIGDNTDMQQVIYGNTEIYTQSATGIATVQVQNHPYGDMCPTACPRVYVTIRSVLIPGWEVNPGASGSNANDGTPITSYYTIPPMRILIGGEAYSPPDYQYIHMASRIRELQQSPDVDL